MFYGKYRMFFRQKYLINKQHKIDKHFSLNDIFKIYEQVMYIETQNFSVKRISLMSLTWGWQLRNSEPQNASDNWKKIKFDATRMVTAALFTADILPYGYGDENDEVHDVSCQYLVAWCIILRIEFRSIGR